MKVLYFSRDYTVHDQRFLKGLSESEHQVGFLCLKNRPYPGAIAGEFSSNGAANRPLPAGIEDLSQVARQAKNRAGKLDDDISLDGLKAIIDKFKPDLIHAGPLHLSAYLAARTGFQPLVSMSWGYDLLYDASRDRTAAEAIRYTLAHSAAMIGDCETIRRLAISYGMPEDRIVTFPWGIDLDNFRPRLTKPEAAKVGPAPFTLLSTRGWEPIYGVEILARAFVQASYVRPEMRLVMLGGGSQASLIHAIFEDGGVLDKVTFPGQVDQEALPKHFQSADLYVSTSHSDGTSISLLEALACGIPALVSDIPGNREWIEPGVQGWWFRDGDPGDLERLLLAVLEERQNLVEYGRAARLLAEKRADWRKNFPKLFEAYDLALNSRQPMADQRRSMMTQ
jgi:L-malate glycosyltransferase